MAFGRAYKRRSGRVYGHGVPAGCMGMVYGHGVPVGVPAGVPADH